MDDNAVKEVQRVLRLVIAAKLAELLHGLEVQRQGAGRSQWAYGPLADLEAALRCFRLLGGAPATTVVNNYKGNRTHDASCPMADAALASSANLHCTCARVTP